MSVRQQNYQKFVYLFFCSTMLSVAQTRQCRMIERIVNNELDRIWKVGGHGLIRGVLYLTMRGVIQQDHEKSDELYAVSEQMCEFWTSVIRRIVTLQNATFPRSLKTTAAN